MCFVSVPIRGLFNLTAVLGVSQWASPIDVVSVPIWGLFNLTLKNQGCNVREYLESFRPHLGII